MPGNCPTQRIGGAAFLMQHSKVQKIDPRIARSTYYTAEEILRHNTPEDCWISYNGLVYNITQYLAWHPPGTQCMAPYFGYDMTEISAKIHCWVNVARMIEPLLIGVLKGRPLTPKDAKELLAGAHKYDEPM